MPREGAFHHLIIVSYPRQDKRSKGNGCAIQHDFMLLTVSFLSPKNIVSTTNDLLYNEASNLQKVYSLDLSSEFPNQIMSLKAVFSEDLTKLNSIKDLEALAKQTEINSFLKRMVTGDEKWIRYENIVRKRLWPKRGEAAQTVAKPGLPARKAL
ncbi:hypothetical protein TNCV_3322011 [Trichonephila clavipes]|nr:hypothetical protein TNCV_3322011 [Trichonephila clavipes]